MALLDETESDLTKAMTKPSQVQVQKELKSKEELKTELKKATDDILKKMRELTDALNNVCSESEQDALEKEVSHVQKHNGHHNNFLISLIVGQDGKAAQRPSQ